MSGRLCPTCAGKCYVDRTRSWPVSGDCHGRYEVEVSRKPAPPNYPSDTLYTVRSRCDHCRGRGMLPDIFGAAA